MTIAQEEIFGPVLSILRYRDEDEALQIANGTAYGLAGGACGRPDAERASAFARRMRTGQVDINGRRVSTRSPVSAASRPPASAASWAGTDRRVRPVPVAAVLRGWVRARCRPARRRCAG